jgi:hypothetical protein
MATSRSDDIDTERLISRFCGSLAPADRGDFRVAAEIALAAIACNGEGVAYRTLREVWRTWFHPPADHAVVGPRHYAASKLSNGPPIGSDDPRCGGRDRTRLRQVV